MPRISSDLVPVLMETAMGRLESQITLLPETAVTVVAASAGYPGTYEKHIPISLPANIPPETMLFHAGTALMDGELVTSGGRVLAVTGMGPDIDTARAAAYQTLEDVRFEGMTHRTDIALLK